MNESEFRSWIKFNGRGRLVLVCAVIAVIVFLGACADGGQDSQWSAGDEKGPLRLISVTPTVLLMREQGALLQVADVEIESTSELSDVKVEVQIGSRQRSTGVGKVEQGKATLQVYVPEVVAATEAEFIVRVGNDVVGSGK